MKIFFYIILLLIISIYTLLKIVEPTTFFVEELTPKNKRFITSKIISICDDKNITIIDKFNKIKYLLIRDVKKVNIVIKDRQRIIVIDNESSKFITDVNNNSKSMWIVDKVYKHLYGYMGVEIKDENIDTFIVKEDGTFNIYSVEDK